MDKTIPSLSRNAPSLSDISMSCGFPCDSEQAHTTETRRSRSKTAQTRMAKMHEHALRSQTVSSLTRYRAF